MNRPAEHVTPQMLLQRCDSPLLLAATRCAIGLAEARGWSAATIAGVFYGLKAVLAGHTGCKRSYPRRAAGLRLARACPARGPLERPPPVREQRLAVVGGHLGLVARRLAPHPLHLGGIP